MALIDPIFDDAHERWAAGRCPCCGLEPVAVDGVDPEAIGEGVLVCGYCVPHMSIPVPGTDHTCREGILLAILEGARVAAGHNNL